MSATGETITTDFSGISGIIEREFWRTEQIRNEKKFIVVNVKNEQFTGTAKEIHAASGIPLSSIYYLVLNNKNKGKKVKHIQEINQAGQQTIEKVSDA